MVTQKGITGQHSDENYYAAHVAQQVTMGVRFDS
jgi:hypothetical protein